MATSEHKIILRLATPLDEELLRYWDKQPHVIEARNSNPDEDDWNWTEELRRSPEWRELLIAEIEERPIGFMQIIDPAREETHYWGDVPLNLRAIDIWIGEERDLGKGYGTSMMRLALERCFALPHVTAILIDPLESNTRVHRFYERLGFSFVEKRLFDEDACLVYRLDRENFSVPSKH
jgi:aminoglycoside 6'-N-acetyltransferase